MRSVGMLPVVVHGGGPQIGALMERVGKVAEFQDGFRVTDADTIDLVRMVLVGKVNRDIVSSINVHGALAVGLSGEDANLITRRRPAPRPSGYVGDVGPRGPGRSSTSCWPRASSRWWPPSATDQSGQAFNINADTAAGALAAALEAEKLVFLTDVSGLRSDPDDPATLIHQVTADDLDRLVAPGAATGGMIPKVEACARAVRSGVARAHILDGRTPHALLLELFTDEGVGHDGGGDRHERPMTRGRRRPLRAHAQLRRAAGDLRPGRGEPAARHRRASAYLDFLSGLAVTSLGHAHPAVAEAIAEQARTLSHVSNLFGNTVGPEVAVTLDRLDRRRHRAGRRPGVLRQLGGRGQRVRAQAGPPVGRARAGTRWSAPGTPSTAGPWPP